MKAKLSLPFISGLLFIQFFASPVLKAEGARVGVQGGLSMATLSETPSTSAETRSGILGGLLWEMDFVVFDFQPEILYVQRGKKNGTLTTKLDYIELPFLFKYKFGLPLIKFFVYGGPNLGIKIKGEAQSGTLTPIDLSSVTSSLLLCGDVGGGVDITVGPVSLFVAARYSLALTNASSVTGVTWKPNTFEILGGVIFGS